MAVAGGKSMPTEQRGVSKSTGDSRVNASAVHKRSGSKLLSGRPPPKQPSRLGRRRRLSNAATS